MYFFLCFQTFRYQTQGYFRRNNNKQNDNHNGDDNDYDDERDDDDDDEVEEVRKPKARRLCIFKTFKVGTFKEHTHVHETFRRMNMYVSFLNIHFE